LNEKPLISVIVTAYNRKKYLPFALRSLEEQTLSKDMFEVIVVKNFEDPESDSIISRNLWKDIYSDDIHMGRFFLEGFKKARGDVITFLEDDDIYAQNRLEELYKAFTRHENLVYFHNSWEFISKKGRRLENSTLQPPRNLIGNGDVIIDVDRLHGLAREYKISVADLILWHVRLAADVNNSSLAVKKYVLEHNYDLLMMLPCCLDNFIFAASIKTGGFMYFTDKKLTFYRIHGENWTPAFAIGKEREIYIKKFRSILQTAAALRLIESQLLEEELNFYACSEPHHRAGLWLIPQTESRELPPELKPKPSDFMKALRCIAKEHSARSTLLLVITSLLLGNSISLKKFAYNLFGRFI